MHALARRPTGFSRIGRHAQIEHDGRARRRLHDRAREQPGGKVVATPSIAKVTRAPSSAPAARNRSGAGPDLLDGGLAPARLIRAVHDATNAAAAGAAQGRSSARFIPRTSARVRGRASAAWRDRRVRSERAGPIRENPVGLLASACISGRQVQFARSKRRARWTARATERARCTDRRHRRGSEMTPARTHDLLRLRPRPRAQAAGASEP